MNLNNLKKLIGKNMVIECDNENDILIYKYDIIVENVDLKNVPCTKINRLIFNNNTINLYFEDYEISPYTDEILMLYIDKQLVNYLCLNNISWYDILEIDNDKKLAAEQKDLLIDLLNTINCIDCKLQNDNNCLFEDEKCIFFEAIKAIK